MSIHGGDVYRNHVDIDFSINVNPLGIPESVTESLHRAVTLCGQYPDPQAERLGTAVSAFLGVPKEYLLFGNGASELFLAIVHGLKPKKVVIPVPSFYGYEYAAKAAGCEIIYAVMKQENNFCLKEDLRRILTTDIDLMFLAHPNNPIGNLLDREMVKKLLVHCREQGICVVVDECFIEFCGNQFSFLSATDLLEHLILVRAFTKIFAIPGVRLGYLVCKNRTLRTKIAAQLPEWNLSCFAQEAGCACAGQTAFVRKTKRYVEQERQFLTERLTQTGVTVFPSVSNFMTCYSDKSLYEKLLKRGILIRDCSNFRGLGKGFYRIAVKSRKENEMLCRAVESLGYADAGSGIWPIKYTRRNQMEDTKIEDLPPESIEARSFEIITEELTKRGIRLPEEEACITKRVIHASADFDYAETLCYSKKAVEILKDLIKNGADIVTDTNMALAGINKKVLAKFGGQVHCFMADEDVALLAKQRNVTRASVCMEKAATIQKPVVFAIGNAPTALLKLYEMAEKRENRKPAFIIGVPVGFVHVEAAKERMMQTDIPYIINRGRKGGSNIAAAICNAVLYQV